MWTGLKRGLAALGAAVVLVLVVLGLRKKDSGGQLDGGKEGIRNESIKRREAARRDYARNRAGAGSDSRTELLQRLHRKRKTYKFSKYTDGL